MKVICNGKDKVYASTCSKCKSDLEYTEDDVFYITEEQKGCTRKTVSHLFKADEHYINVYMQEFRCVKCPVCGHILKSMSLRNGLPKIETVRWEKIV